MKSQTSAPPKSQILQEIREKWRIQDDLKFIRKVENWIYHAAKDRLFVRVTEPSHRSSEQIQSELNWLRHLQSHGVRFAHPMPAAAGTLVEAISFEDQAFSVSVFIEAEGRPLKEPADFTSEVFHSWGEVLGRLHHATKSYRPKEDIHRRPEWNTERNYHDIIALRNPADGGVDRQSYRLFELFESLPQGPDEYGLIHGDLHRGNFHVDKKNSVIAFDFDDCQYHWFAYDIGVVYFHLEKKDFLLSWDEFEEYFWAGYESQNKLSAEWRGRVPDFIRYRAVVLYYWCQKNLDNPTMSTQAREWMVLKMKFCREMME